MHPVNTSCEKNCDECPNCYNLTEYRLRDILYAINEKIVQHSEYIICTLLWGYGCKKGIKDGDFEKLLNYQSSIERYYQSLRTGYELCLCPSEIQEIVEKTLDLVDLSCCTSPKRKDVKFDESGLDLWVLENPGCVAYEAWERHLIRIVPLIGISVKSVNKSCDILATVKEVTDKCKFLYTISVYNVANSCITTKVKVSEKECKLEYKTLIKEHNCNFSFDVYTKLKECNMTPKVITNLLSCGVTVGYNVEKKCPQLTIGTKSVAMCDTKINVFSNNVDKKLLSEFSGGSIDPYELDKLVESYVDSCQLIRKNIS